MSLSLTLEACVLEDQIDLIYCLVHSWLIVLDSGRNLSSIFSLPFNPYYFLVQAFPWLHFVIVTVVWYILCNTVCKNCKIYTDSDSHCKIIALPYSRKKTNHSQVRTIVKKKKVKFKPGWFLLTYMKFKQNSYLNFQNSTMQTTKVFGFTLGSMQAVIYYDYYYTFFNKFSVLFYFLYNTFHRK
jgi:hypothetical protein